MKRLIIIGAGGFGREVLMTAKTVQAQRGEWEIAGFLDDNPAALADYGYKVPILGSINEYLPQKNDCFIIAMESPQNKLAISQQLQEKGAEFITLIHPSAEIGDYTKIGIGCVLLPHIGISCDVTLGNFVTLNAHAAVGHDAVLSDGCTLSAFAHVSGAVNLGKGAYVGIHGCILPSVEVGDFAVVAAGSVVVKNVKPGTTVMGVPAKKIL
jgi:sugar O-acyltransferase (sialic acid O-acetyltransferase NeuD family)